MQDQIDAADAPAPPLTEGPATHIQIRISYQWMSPGSIRAQTEVLFAGVRPAGYSGRVTCGLLLMAMGCFEIVYGETSEPLVGGYTDCILVSTQTRQIFTTEPENVNRVISEIISLHARELSVPMLTEAMIAVFIGEAVEVLNGTSEKINAVGGAA